jgi:hypothetical protein
MLVIARLPDRQRTQKLDLARQEFVKLDLRRFKHSVSGTAGLMGAGTGKSACTNIPAELRAAVPACTAANSAERDNPSASQHSGAVITAHPGCTQYEQPATCCLDTRENPPSYGLLCQTLGLATGTVAVAMAGDQQLDRLPPHNAQYAWQHGSSPIELFPHACSSRSLAKLSDFSHQWPSSDGLNAALINAVQCSPRLSSQRIGLEMSLPSGTSAESRHAIYNLYLQCHNIQHPCTNNTTPIAAGFARQDTLHHAVQSCAGCTCPGYH